MSVRSVICAISGGVDSAVAAILLKRQGYAVTGVFMKNWDGVDERGVCTSDHDREDAMYVCDRLNIPFHEANFVKDYWNEVFTELISGYQNGFTPNPDILCNKHVKFGAFQRYVTEHFSASWIATGHYAVNSYGSFMESVHSGKAKLLKAADQSKDQTLFLSQISQSALQRTMFPVGKLLKKQVKQIAKSQGLERIVKKKESTGICFIGKRNFHDFIAEYIEPKQGVFIDAESGATVGTHDGAHFWTIGQRVMLKGFAKALFVSQINPQTQEVFVVQGTDHPALYMDTLVTDLPHWIGDEPERLRDNDVLACDFRFQHIHPTLPCSVHKLKDGRLVINLSKPLRSIAAGQYAVLYSGEECLGSARICRTGPTVFELSQRRVVC